MDETEACFIVKDRNGQALAYVYCEDEPGRRAAANLLTHDEAHRIAASIAKLPKLLKRPAERQKGALRRSRVFRRGSPETDSVSSLFIAMRRHIAARSEYSRLISKSSCCFAISAHSAAHFRHSSASSLVI